ncbi:RNA-directed DNA polymerase, eukaryota, nucleotide-binding alpha-beta plait domain protein [Tanacetum coccineum]
MGYYSWDAIGGTSSRWDTRGGTTEFRFVFGLNPTSLVIVFVMGFHHQNSLQSKLDQTAKISKSVFITNFSEECTSKDLWKVCNDYGTVIDVFIPNKRSKSGKRFAFVRFIKVSNLDRLVENLNTISLLIELGSIGQLYPLLLNRYLVLCQGRNTFNPMPSLKRRSCLHHIYGNLTSFGDMYDSCLVSNDLDNCVEWAMFSQVDIPSLLLQIMTGEVCAGPDIQMKLPSHG